MLKRREFMFREVPVHLVTTEQAGFAPSRRVNIEEIRTVSLADLINLKLCSGTSGVKRSQDVADVLGLIRKNQLTGSFASKNGQTVSQGFQGVAERRRRLGRD